MSRSGYSDDWDDHWATIRWRGAVNAAIKGKRGQAFLKEMLVALDALPEKVLIAEELQDTTYSGQVCAIGAVGRARGVDMEKLDPEDRATVAGTFRISDALTAEIVYMNDEGAYRETPAMRFARMRRWIESQIVASETAKEPA